MTMKKEYIQPTIEVVEIKAKLTLLTGSFRVYNGEEVNEEDEL